MFPDVCMRSKQVTCVCDLMCICTNLKSLHKETGRSCSKEVVVKCLGCLISETEKNDTIFINPYSAVTLMKTVAGGQRVTSATVTVCSKIAVFLMIGLRTGPALRSLAVSCGLQNSFGAST